MKPLVMLLAACILTFSAEVRAQSTAAEDQYFDVYTLILKADTMASKGRLDQARTNYLNAVVSLKKLQEDYPLWQTKVVKYRLEYLTAKINAMPLPAKKPAAPAAATNKPPAAKPGSAAPAAQPKAP